MEKPVRTFSGSGRTVGGLDFVEKAKELIRLARDRTALKVVSRFQPILTDLHRRNQVQRFSIVNIEPARVTKRGFGFFDVALFGE